MGRELRKSNGVCCRGRRHGQGDDGSGSETNVEKGHQPQSETKAEKAHESIDAKKSQEPGSTMIMVAFDRFDRSVDGSICSIDSIDSIFGKTQKMKLPLF